MKLLLQINNNWENVEMDKEENEFSLNYHYGALDSPSDYVGEFALDFKLPRTQNNNRLFEQYFRVDSVVTPLNVYDPAIKLPYKILSDYGDVISEGMGYINQITKENYIFVLNGALFSVFSKAINSGWNTQKAGEDDEYFLLPEFIAYDGQNYTNTPAVTSKLIFQNWANDNFLYDWERLKQNYPNYNPDNRQENFSGNSIGWMPTHQGTADGISVDKWVASPNKDPLNGEHLLPMWSYNNNEISFPLADTPTEYQMADFRSYNQQPCIYILRLWQWYNEFFEQITGYQMELDSAWFNSENPYFAKLCYTLPKLGDYIANNADAGFSDTSTASTPLPYGDPQSVYLYGFNGLSLTNIFNFPTGFKGGNFIINWMPKIILSDPRANFKIFNWYEDCFVVTIQQYSQNNALKKEKKIGFAVCPYIEISTGVYLRPKTDIINWLNNNTDNWNFYYFPMPAAIQSNIIGTYVNASQYGRGFDIDFSAIIENGDYMKITTEIYSPNEYAPFVCGYWDANGHPPTYWNHNGTTFATEINLTCTPFKQRTGQPLTLERLFANENPFEILLKYTKYLNLVWLVDEETKKVKVTPRYQHFFDCMNDGGNLPDTGTSKPPINGILDLSDKVNKAKDVKVLPIDWNDKYIYLNFEDADADFLKEYKQKYNRTYGSKLLQTPNKRVKNQKEFFEEKTVVEASDVTPYYIAIGSCYMKKPLAYKADRLLLNSKDNNTKTADLHGQFVFRNQNSGWDANLTQNFRNNVIISDDTQFEIGDEKIYYHGNKLNGDTEITTRPVFSPIYTDKDVSFWFAFPREAYAPMNYAETTQTLFDLWRGYLYEIYNVNNKTIEVYINLPSAYYKRLKINPLCQIDNCVYIMMSMDGWNEKTEFVKCTLKQFGSIDNLTAGAVVRNSDIADVWLWDNDAENVINWDNGATIPTQDKDTLQPPVNPLYPPVIDSDVTPVVPATPIPYDLPTLINNFVV